MNVFLAAQLEEGFIRQVVQYLELSESFNLDKETNYLLVKEVYHEFADECITEKWCLVSLYRFPGIMLQRPYQACAVFAVFPGWL